MADEKMIPLDTDGNDVEVTLKEEVTEGVEVPESNVREIFNDDPIVEVKEEVKKEEVKKEEGGELEEYSATVKKRIDKLTRKMRESERREQAALEYAKKVQAENKQLNNRSTETNKAYVSDLTNRVTAQIDSAKNNLKNAITNGDVDKQVDYQREISSLTQEEDRVRREKIKLDRLSEAATIQADSNNSQVNKQRAWFGQDQVMTYAAYGLHQQLTETEGYDPRSEEYYEEIDLRIKKEFPHRFKESKVQENSSNGKPVQAVASANRSTKSGRRIVRLTPSQVTISKRLGVPLEEYAKYVKE
jgi:hypothetical protein